MNYAVDFALILFFSLVWLGLVIFLWRKKRKSPTYLIFFTLFFVYLYKVLDYTLFQFQTLLVLKYFMPNLMLNGMTSGESVNLVPLITLGWEDLKTSLLNILLLVPFGFGLQFVTKTSLKKILVCGFLFSLAIEIMQFATGYFAGITFRVADINDLIFNTFGAVIGYCLFKLLVRTYRSAILNV